ncbi:MAG: DUF551 domain-containing protein [Coprococcus sp.]
MNELEKILEEIKEKTIIVPTSKEHYNHPQNGKFVEEVVTIADIEEIIRKHMDGATDTDDTEEKIREHIAECLHRIDNIRSFVGSKKYTNNDEKCIRNIEVLKTSITALEEYLSSKKKNGNNGWIPVEERLPEETTGKYYPEMIVTTSYGAVTWGFYRVMDKQWYIYSNIHNEFVKAGDKEIVAWQPLPEPYKPKKDITASGKEHIMSRFMKVE